MIELEAIKTYLDNVFGAYPQTGELQALKRDMLANMEEKYTALRQDGKSEHEAAYRIMADFGSIEEIAAELGLAPKGEEVEDTIFLTWDEAQTYCAKSKTSGIWIGFGVWLIIAGVSSVMLLGNAFPLFLATAVAVTIFIINGGKMGAYESYNKTPICFDLCTREKIEAARAKYMPRCSAMVAVGLAAIIISVGAFTFSDFPVPLFMNIVAFSVFLFIVAGVQHSAFDILLGKGDYANKRGIRESERVTDIIAAVYWPVVTIVGLWLLFTGNSYFWATWPIAGVLFWAVSAGISAWLNTKKSR